MQRLTLALLLFIFIHASRAQTFILSGKVSDKNEALPFATIMVKGNAFATNSNANGQYTLKLPPGSYEVIYQYIGYTKKTIKVELSSNKQLDVVLEQEGVALNEVEIKAGEDPAYPIIRKAIKKRRYYAGQVESYTCKAYIKGLQKINQLPKNLEALIKIGGGDLSDTNDLKGVVYLSESESKYHFRKPEDEKEIMFSSKVSGDNKSFSFNQLSDMKINFYNNLVEMGNLSDRPFTSPLHDNAMLFYKYYLLGTITEENKTVYKIKVVQKRKSDPCFSGIIYIQDSTWRLTSADLLLTKEAKIDFVDTLQIRQLHTPVLGDSIWMPSTLHLSFDFKAFGFKGAGYFNANIREYEFNPEFPKRFFRNEVLKVEEDANKKDSAYWEQHRAVPLTQEEINDYREKDSIFKIRNSPKYIDSVDKKNNKLKIRDIFMGYTYHNTPKKTTLSLPGIVTNGVQYNTVEGLNLSYRLSYRKSFENFRQYEISGQSRYGFANKLWGGELSYFNYFKPEKFSSFSVKVKSIVEQFNKAEPIAPVINSSYTLFYNENFMKLFKESGGQVNYNSELTNGVYLNATVSYYQRDALRNTSYFQLVDDKNKYFTSNNPLSPALGSPEDFQSNRALTADVILNLRFKQKYYTLPHQKIISGSKYPRLAIGYRKAIPTLLATADYDLIWAGINDNVRLGLFGDFGYKLRSGRFLNTRSMYFMDYKHFLGNQTALNTHDYLNSYRLLPYYQFSTNTWFTEAHAEHHFRGLILNNIPLLKKLSFQEVIGAHFLSTKELKYYYELNFGIEKILKVIRFDYILVYAHNQKLNSGFTIGINLSL